MLLELFEKSVDRLISLLRERQMRRHNVFEEIIEPVHSVFLQFRAEHVATFEEIRRLLLDPSRRIKDALELVESRMRVERPTWMLMKRLEDLEVGKHVDAENYLRYFRLLQSCLVKTY